MKYVSLLPYVCVCMCVCVRSTSYWHRPVNDTLMTNNLLGALSIQFSEKMYFVVSLIDCENKHIVVPVKWILNHKMVMEKFVNYSINKHRVHICFLNGTEGAVLNGENMDADFSTPLKTRFELLEKGCYHVKIVKYFGK